MCQVLDAYLCAFIPRKNLSIIIIGYTFSDKKVQHMEKLICFPKLHCQEMVALGLLKRPEMASIFRPSWIQQQMIKSIGLYCVSLLGLS